MFIFDSGKKFFGDTLKLEAKKNVMIMCAGIIAYLANKNGDFIGSTYSKDDLVRFYPFKTGNYNIERILAGFENDVTKSDKSNITLSLLNVYRGIG